MIQLDGGEGEGGGQILRSALALSLCTGQPFRIRKIRAKRAKPGLLRQHLTAVRAAAEISRSSVEGAEIGSQDLTFHPGTVSGGGEYRFAVGTAGSATLVLQTVLPPLLLAPAPSVLTLEGGTHNPMAPPYDFLTEVFLPVLGKMGVTVAAELERYGFYPAGGGSFRIRIAPVEKLQPFELVQRGERLDCGVTVLIAGLSRRIAEREIAAVLDRMNWPEDRGKIVTVNNSLGPGNVIFIRSNWEHCTEICTGFGEKGVTAETVSKVVSDEMLHYLSAEAPVGEHLADQLMLPAALAPGSRYLATQLSTHSRTNRSIIDRFLPGRLAIQETPRGVLVES